MNARIEELTKKINHYNQRYYQDAVSEVSDYDFDKLLAELITLENQYPEFKQADSPTQRVGGGITKSFDTIQHRYPMLSLSNTYNEQEILDWDERIRKTLGEESYEFVCEIKFDGISLSMTYENSILKQALTRGDGTKGDDITNNVKTIRTLPLSINNYQLSITNDSKNTHHSFEVRGEGFMPITSFNRLNQEREEMGENLLANPRNAASGAFKMQDSAEVAKRGLDCYVYQFLSEDDIFETHEQSLIAIKQAGFQVSDSWRKVKTIEEVIAYIKEWEQKRHTLPCATDGIVIKINNYKQREELGFTSKSPRWAIAYKYKAESKSTLLKSVTFQVGRTGAVTPVAELEPIELAQTMVKRATLHNADEIERLGLCLGDYVFVEKAGEIIPKITGVDENRRQTTDDRQQILFIENCPACGTLLVRKEGEAAYYCTNEKDCPPQVKGKIEHFIQRKAMNIDSLGEGKLELLFDKGLVKNIADLYDLKYEQLLGLEKTTIDEAGKERKTSFKEKTVQNILEGIEKSKEQPFSKVLFSIGIRFVGETTAEKLAAYFKNMDTLLQADFEALRQVPDVGEKVAQSFIAFFAESENIEILNRLKAVGLQFEASGLVVEQESNNLEGKTFLYTGTFSNFTREELEAKIEANGGKLLSGVSKKLNFLIVGDGAGPSKLQKAEQLGVKMINEEEFSQMVN